MMTPSEAVAQLRENSIDVQSAISEVDPLSLGECALFEGEDELCAVIQSELTQAQIHFLLFRRAQLDNDADAAQVALTACVTSSRERGERDHTLEARARMEWGLLRFALGESEQAGVDLKWAMERLNALEEGSTSHGLAMLNMAAWHESVGEPIMALAIHSQISRHGPHLVETIALSRLRAAHLTLDIGDLQSSLRHSWVSFQGLRDTEMAELVREAALLWLDVALNEVSDEAPSMQERVETAKPRNPGDGDDARSNPADISQILEWLVANWDGDASGELRPDIAVMIEAEQAIGQSAFQERVSQLEELSAKDVVELLTDRD